MSKKDIPITPVVEPAVHEDKVFLQQVGNLIDKNDFVYMVGVSSDVLTDRHCVPIFDIRPAEYGMVSEAQRINSSVFLRHAPAIIKRLFYIIKEREEDGREEKK